MAARPNLYTCVNCGGQVQELYKQYSSSVLKLVHCDKCHEIADKYIEYDPAIIMIDLVLLNEQAYRHILYNSPFQNHWRLAVILVLLEAYSEWASHKDVESAVSSRMSPYDFLEGEQSFCFECLRSTVGSFMLLLVTYTLTWLRWWVRAESTPQNYSNVILWNALVLSNCGKFLIIPSLIWGKIGTETHSLFITGYIVLSKLKIYSVVCETSKVGAGFVILCGLSVKYFVCYMISNMKLQ